MAEKKGSTKKQTAPPKTAGKGAALNDAVVKQLESLQYEICTDAQAIKELAGLCIDYSGEDTALAVAIRNMSEKVGYMADTCIAIINSGQPGVCGDYNEWCGMNKYRPENQASDTREAAEVSHG